MYGKLHFHLQMANFWAIINNGSVRIIFFIDFTSIIIPIFIMSQVS